MYKFRYLIWGFFILLFGLSFALLFTTFSTKQDPIDYGADKKDLNVVFTEFEGKIYASVPSNGYYEVKEADPATFKVFTDSYQDAHIGYDHKNVYAGNIILEGLDPKNLKILGNNYYTDGKTTYYCARNSEKNDDLSAVGFVLQLIGESMGLSGKPQNYWYPFQELPKDNVYQSTSNYALAVNGQTAFYKGLEMKQANPRSIRPISTHYWDGDVRTSQTYFTDGTNVYYQNDLLPLKYNPSIKQIDVEGDIPSRSAYLIDDKQGMVYVDGKAFDDSKAPYRLLGMNLDHAYQVIFVSKDGLYFYDTEAEKVRRAGDNPFAGNQFQELAPDVFASGGKVYFLRATEQWRRKRGLQSRTTHLVELKEVATSGLKKISAQDFRSGSVWQSGKRYFYFDDLGSSQLMPSAVYEISDAQTVQLLSNATNVRTDDIRQLRYNKKLTEPEGESIVEAVTKSGSDWYESYWLIFGIIPLVYLISFLFRNTKMAPFLIKDGYLIMNNLTFKKYKIEEIDRVLFRSVVTNSKIGGYSGTMQVKLKNGKSSFSKMFSTRFTLTPESDNQVIAYIRELQKELKEAAIESAFH